MKLCLGDGDIFIGSCPLDLEWVSPKWVTKYKCPHCFGDYAISQNYRGYELVHGRNTMRHYSGHIQP